MQIVSFCTVSTGLIGLKYAIDNKIEISKIVGLHPTVADEEKISGYIDIGDFCRQNNVEFEYVYDYSLKTIKPSDLYDKADIIWIAGWQRLLPTPFINSANIATIGAHGSCDGILKGRGRSPQNWALLLGKESFEVSLFKIDEGIDAGATIVTNKITLRQDDSIFNSYLKVSLSCAIGMQSIVENPALIMSATMQEGEPEYFPKRIADDGFIDWDMSASDIYNQIRALATPYPNARTLVDGSELRINKASIIGGYQGNQNGQVAYCFPTGELLVTTGEGSILLEEYEFSSQTTKPPPTTEGIRFTSVSMKKTVKNIVERFEKEFKGKKLNSSLVTFWKSRGVFPT